MEVNMIVIGQTYELDKDSKYPSIKELINMPIKEKKKVIGYMKKCKVVAVAPAIVRDVINPEIKIPELLLMSDGKYEWRSDVIYYVEKYDMELPEEFIQ
jgi:SUMO ligase MMS21 Smc5/6 complex component